MTTNETPTPRTDQYVADYYNVRMFDAQHCFDFARELERELAAERALADRLATSLDVLLEYVETGDGAEHSHAHTASRALDAWKEARRGA